MWNAEETVSWDVPPKQQEAEAWKVDEAACHHVNTETLSTEVALAPHQEAAEEPLEAAEAACEEEVPLEVLPPEAAAPLEVAVSAAAVLPEAE